MQHDNLAITNDKGAVLIGTILVLVAVTVLGVTLISLSINNMKMATNEKCKETARYNGQTCAVAGIKLIRLTGETAAETGQLGILAGDDDILGITYADPETSLTAEAEFASKVFGALDDEVCEDFGLDVADTSITAGGNLLAEGPSAHEGTAANRQMSGYSYGIGLGGAGGGGFNTFFVLACRGTSCAISGRHAAYVRYKRVPGIDGGM